MKQPVENETELRRYLLGDLSQEEHLRVAERLFLEHDYFQLLKSTEDDLIDEYVYDELPVTERKKFEKQFLSDEDRADDIRVAKALKKYISTNVPAPAPVLEEHKGRQVADPMKAVRSLFGFLGGRPIAKLSLALVSLALILGGIWVVVNLIYQQTRPVFDTVQLPDGKGPGGEQQNNGQEKNRQPETKETQAQPEQRAQQSGENQPARTPEKEEAASRESRAVNKNNRIAPRPSSSVHVALLMPGGIVREDGETNLVRLPASATTVDLQLPLISETKYRSYRAILQTDDGENVSARSGLKDTLTETGRVVSLKVPAKLLRPQRYRLVLSGVQNDGSVRDISAYSFQIQILK